MAALSEKSGPANSGLRSKFAGLAKPVQIAVSLALIGVVAAFLFWLFNEAIYYFTARRYVDEIAWVFNLNRHLANAITLVLFVLLAWFGARVFSLDKQNRQVGYLGLLALLIANSLILWAGTRGQYFGTAGESTKCYVLTRAGQVKYLEHAGVDPDTGRTCKPYSPDMLERLKSYEGGKRPERVDADDPVFFDPRSGQPVLWYVKNRSGNVELFNLMGFHPETGEELQPATPEIAEAYKRQVQSGKRPVPRRVDVDDYAPFDPISGRPKVWYWRSPERQYEFYDSPGFHPRTGEALQIITKEVVDAWRRESELIEQGKRQRQALEDRVRREAQEREENERREREEHASKLAQSGDLCDQAAANPNDRRKPDNVPGVRFRELAAQAASAAETCRIAVESFSSEPRYLYQYARALSFSDEPAAIAIYRKLTRQNYAAAYDNLANLLRNRGSTAEAIAVLKRGADIDDPDSLVTLSEWVEAGIAPSKDPQATKFVLLSRAAQLGHRGAAIAVEQQRTQMQQTQQQQQIMLDMFRSVVQGIGAAAGR